MAKDNVPFHSVMFPATLLAINKNYQMVTHIMATGMYEFNQLILCKICQFVKSIMVIYI